MLRAVASAQAIRPASACLARAFHAGAPLYLPKNSQFVDERRVYREQISQQRKKFQAEVAEQAVIAEQQAARADDEIKAAVEQRRAEKAARGADARAKNRAMHAEMRALKTVRIRKGQKQQAKLEKKNAAMREKALLHLKANSGRWIASEDQIEQAITAETMRPYYPSFVWRPIDTRHFQGMQHAKPEMATTVPMPKRTGPERGSIRSRIRGDTRQ